MTSETRWIKKAMCFDFGLRCIGIAVGQRFTGTAQALPILLAKDGIPRWEEVTALIQEWEPDALVIGIPLNMDGTEQDMTHKAREFGVTLTQKFHLPLFEVDERLSTRAAKELMFAQEGGRALRKRADSIAAQLLLEEWFRSLVLSESVLSDAEEDEDPDVGE